MVFPVVVDEVALDRPRGVRDLVDGGVGLGALAGAARLSGRLGLRACGGLRGGAGALAAAKASLVGAEKAPSPLLKEEYIRRNNELIARLK